MSDTTLGIHGGVQLAMRPDGIFYATVDGLLLTNSTLAGLKTRIDNYRRATTRTRATAVEVAVLVLGSEWVGGDTRRATAVWHRGVFGGVNAHTGVITIVKANNQKVVIDEASWFFRADDREAIAQVQALIDERLRTDEAATNAKRKLYDELKQRGIRVGDRYQSKGTEKAAATEDALITALEAKSL